MKRIVLICLLVMVSPIAMRAQYAIGMSGMLNTGSAEMNETGTFMIGGNLVPPELMPKGFQNYYTGNYFVNITLFSFLELNYRCTLFKSSYQGGKFKFNQQDRSLSAKIKLLKERKLCPAIAIGTNDPFKEGGTNYFSSIYGVATKTFHLGQSQLALTAGYYHPLRTEERLKTQKGMCGGISYSPAFYRQLTVMTEYDSQRFNIGAAVKLWKHLSIHAFTSDFNCIAGGIRYECTLIH